MKRIILILTSLAMLASLLVGGGSASAKPFAVGRQVVLTSASRPAAITGYPAVPSVCATVRSEVIWGIAAVSKGHAQSYLDNTGTFCLRGDTGPGTPMVILYFTTQGKLLLAQCDYGATSCTAIWYSGNAAHTNNILSIGARCSLQIQYAAGGSYTEFNAAKPDADAFCTLQVLGNNNALAFTNDGPHGEGSGHVVFQRP